MDEIDCKILDALKENGRATSSEISKKVALSVPAVAESTGKRICVLETFATVSVQSMFTSSR